MISNEVSSLAGHTQTKTAQNQISFRPARYYPNQPPKQKVEKKHSDKFSWFTKARLWDRPKTRLEAYPKTCPKTRLKTERGRKLGRKKAFYGLASTTPLIGRTRNAEGPLL